ncbi:MAG: lamin tail domain-containing protein [Planctomycetota bacterium]
MPSNRFLGRLIAVAISFISCCESQANAGLMISEVMFSPGTIRVTDGTFIDKTPAWVEIYNSSEDVISLTGVELEVSPGTSGGLGGLGSGGPPFSINLDTPTKEMLAPGEFVVFYDNSNPSTTESLFREIWTSTPTNTTLVGVNGGGSWSDGIPSPMFGLKHNGSTLFQTAEFNAPEINKSFYLPNLSANAEDLGNWELAGGLSSSGSPKEASLSGVGTPGFGPNAVPEPSGLVMFASVLGLSGLSRRRRFC